MTINRQSKFLQILTNPIDSLKKLHSTNKILGILAWIIFVFLAITFWYLAVLFFGIKWIWGLKVLKFVKIAILVSPLVLFSAGTIVYANTPQGKEAIRVQNEKKAIEKANKERLKTEKEELDKIKLEKRNQESLESSVTTSSEIIQSSSQIITSSSISISSSNSPVPIQSQTISSIINSNTEQKILKPIYVPKPEPMIEQIKPIVEQKKEITISKEESPQPVLQTITEPVRKPEQDFIPIVKQPKSNPVVTIPIPEKVEPQIIPQSGGYTSGTCADLKKMGMGNFYRGDVNYTSARDRDKDGIACEM